MTNSQSAHSSILPQSRQTLNSSFDYQQLDTETRIVIQQEDKELDRNMSDGSRHYVLGGRNLARIQEVLRYKRPGFIEYLKAKRIPQSTAYKLIHIGQMFTDSVNISSVEALVLLAAPSTPDEAREEAIERAQNGETITHAAAKGIINGHKPPTNDLDHTSTLDDTQSLFADDPHLNAALEDESKSICPECGQVHDGDACPDCQPKNGYNYKRDNKSSAPRYTPQGLDACQTPAYALDPLLPYLPEGWTIWEPACGEGLLEDALLDSYLEVVSGDLQAGQDFFEYEPEYWDCQVTNPPFSRKFPWLKRSYELGKPFALLLPVETLGAEKAAVLFEEFGVEIIFMRPRINFKMPNKGWEGAGSQFPVAWFTWGLGIGRQMTFAKINDHDNH